MKIKIGAKTVGEGHPCFIIAEAGVNHNGSFAVARKMVDAACAAGADAIKFQTFKSGELVTKSAATAQYQKENTGGNVSQIEMLKKLELSPAEFIKLKKYCDRKGIIFLSTPHTENALKFLDPLVPAHKIGSGDLTNLPLLKKAASTGKPVLISTGMGTMDEIRDAVSIITGLGFRNPILLHCTSLYPCPPEEANLRMIETLRKEFNLQVGFSDHTAGIYAAPLAVALGAVVIEKHFTLDKKMKGPDHKASLNPEEFRVMTGAVRYAEKALGSGLKRVSAGENEIKTIVRKSVVADTDIPKGAVIRRDMLAVKRPGGGIRPALIDRLPGRKTKTAIKRDSLISWNQIEK